LDEISKDQKKNWRFLNEKSDSFYRASVVQNIPKKDLNFRFGMRWWKAEVYLLLSCQLDSDRERDPVI
jgi:hypothetical protein